MDIKSGAGSLLFLALSMCCGTAAAEQGCPDGFTPNAAPVGTAGQNQCIPIPGLSRPNSGGGNYGPSGWKNAWGSIFFDSENAIVGIGEGEKNRSRARKAALEHCKSKGGKDCKEVLSYRNQCAAVVWGPSPTGQGFVMDTMTADTFAAAAVSAKEQCEPRSATGKCEIFYSGCSEPTAY